MNPALDRIDFEILSALQNNARLSNKELAASIGLAPSSCLERVRRLERNAVFRGFHAEVEPRAVGIGLQALVFVRLRRHSRPRVEAFRDYALSLPEVIGLFHVTGEFDYLVRIAVRDADHLRNLLMDSFTTRTEVAHLETHLIFEYIRKPALPSLEEPEANPEERLRRPRRVARRG
jgi:DNA-binding Lrp family transcriptional regulator